MVRRRQEQRGLTTLLFTDIVGSSEVATELGDRRWKTLQGRHHAEVRRQLKRFGGHEVDTAGDGFFATFGSPEAGGRCAFAIVQAVRTLGLDVRAGLHIGVAELSGEKVSGIAVTTASRVSAAARPGQVLATDTIAHLVAGSGFGFTDLGSRQLKGVPGTWDLFSLDAIDGVSIGVPLDPSKAAEIRKRSSPEAQAGRNRRLLVSGIVAGVLVVALIAAVAIPRSSHSSPPASSPSAFSGAVAARVTLSDGRVDPVNVPNIPIDVPVASIALTRPTGLAGQSFAWYLTLVHGNRKQRSQVTQIDRETTNIVDATSTLSCVSAVPCLAVVGHRVWIVVGTKDLFKPGLSVTGIDAAAKEPPIRMPVSADAEIGSVRGMVFGDGSLWIAENGLGLVLGVNLSTHQIYTIPLPGGVDSIAFGEGSIWVVDQTKGLLERIDPGSRKVVGQTGLSGDPTSLVVGGGYVWVTDGSGDALERIPMSLAGSTPIPVGGQPVAVAFTNGAVWVANHDDATVSKVDPTSGAVIRTYPVGLHPSALAVDGDQLWVAGTPSGIDRS